MILPGARKFRLSWDLDQPVQLEFSDMVLGYWLVVECGSPSEEEAITWYDGQLEGSTAFFSPENGRWISGFESTASSVAVFGEA